MTPRDLGCVRLGNLDLDLGSWIFGFPGERRIRKRISRRILFIEILTRHGFPTGESATESVVGFCVWLEVRGSRFWDLNPVLPIERTLSLFNRVIN